jgi:crotonobetainyl-CoA:carnitine CoA-transferase CaiB-like acyl-CoA transferase
MSGTLSEFRVLDFSHQIAGPYASKLLCDAGAQVIKVEPPGGDSLRRWRASAPDSKTKSSALFDFLNTGKRSVVGEVNDPAITDLLADTDLVIQAHGLESDTGPKLDVQFLRGAYPSLVVLSITPYGLTGPWATRKATEFTLQAESGSIALRGLMGREPFQAGGRIGEWAAGSYGAVAALLALRRARQTSQGESIDLSILETANLIFTNFSDSMNRLMNGGAEDPPHAFLGQSVETPSIEPTRDGYVGFCTNSRQQFSDFLLLIEREDLRDDEELAQFAGRLARFDEWSKIIGAWLSERTSGEIIEKASLLRIPVAPVCNGKTVQTHPHLAARGVFVPVADQAFVQPRRPYRIDGAEPPPPLPPPALGEHTGAGFAKPALGKARTSSSPGALPLAGIRVLDLTAWWAGPSASHILACFGAEVIHVEAAQRPDGMRMIGGMMAAHYPEWWEASVHFLQANSNKLGLTLDLNNPRGLELLEALIAKCDAVVENFTPRVLDNFGLDWDRVRALNPRAIMMRMPAFGLSGPWRDNTGFAQTMEQLSGLAWLTGHADDQPRIPRGPCDPIAGMHAAFAFLVTLTGQGDEAPGHHVESTMVESALNVAAEQVLEQSAYGHLMERDGNRSLLAAPQGLYSCAGSQPGAEKWLALSIASDAQWRALRHALGEPGWATDSELDSRAGRRHHHDAIDRELGAWTKSRELGPLLAELRELGIPASEVANACTLLQNNPQFQARGYFERAEHPTVGPLPLPSLPFRFESIDRWLRSPAPTLGQHNEEILCGILGLPPEALAELEAEGVIGTRPEGL